MRPLRGFRLTQDMVDKPQVHKFLYGTFHREAWLQHSYANALLCLPPIQASIRFLTLLGDEWMRRNWRRFFGFLIDPRIIAMTMLLGFKEGEMFRLGLRLARCHAFWTQKPNLKNDRYGILVDAMVNPFAEDDSMDCELPVFLSLKNWKFTVMLRSTEWQTKINEGKSPFQELRGDFIRQCRPLGNLFKEVWLVFDGNDEENDQESREGNVIVAYARRQQDEHNADLFIRDLFNGKLAGKNAWLATDDYGLRHEIEDAVGAFVPGHVVLGLVKVNDSWRTGRARVQPRAWRHPSARS